MAFDHYIPASYLGRFSTDPNPVRRKRLVWAVDRREGRLFETAPGAIGGEHNFYTLSPKNSDPLLVDSQWEGYENNLNSALDKLIAGRIEALEWLNTLVVFGAALLVRGRDFEARFAERLGSLGATSFNTRDNTNMVRLMELQRLLASIIGARWLLLEGSGRLPQITNDIGYTPFLNPKLKESGLAIPVGEKHLLLIIACRKRVIARAHEGRWVPVIEHGTLDDQAHAGFRESIAAAAQRYVVGPSEAALRPFAGLSATPPPIPEPVMLGFLDSTMARVYEMVYFSTLTTLSTPPRTPQSEVGVDYDKNMPNAQRDSV